MAHYQIHLIAVNTNSIDVVSTSNSLYDSLVKSGIEVLFDDRANISPGFKFKDADLLGMPLQIIVGDKSLKNDQIEIKMRRTGKRTLVALNEAVLEIKQMLRELV